MSDTEATLEVRLAELERRGKANYDLLQKTLKTLDNRTMKLAEKFKAIDQSHHLEMAKRHDELSDRMQLLIEKITVATECCFHLRHKKGMADSVRGRKLAAILWAFDLEDDWWKEGLKYSIGDEKEGLSVVEWIKRCFDAYRDTELQEKTNED